MTTSTCARTTGALIKARVSKTRRHEYHGTLIVEIVLVGLAAPIDLQVHIHVVIPNIGTEMIGKAVFQVDPRTKEITAALVVVQSEIRQVPVQEQLGGEGVGAKGPNIGQGSGYVGRRRNDRSGDAVQPPGRGQLCIEIYHMGPQSNTEFRTLVLQERVAQLTDVEIHLEGALDGGEPSHIDIAKVQIIKVSADPPVVIESEVVEGQAPVLGETSAGPEIGRGVILVDAQGIEVYVVYGLASQRRPERSIGISKERTQTKTEGLVEHRVERWPRPGSL